MPNPWIEHIKKFAKDNNSSFGCALSNPECKNTYKSVKSKTNNKTEESKTNNKTEEPKKRNRKEYLDAIRNFKEDEYLDSIGYAENINIKNQIALADLPKKEREQKMKELEEDRKLSAKNAREASRVRSKASRSLFTSQRTNKELEQDRKRYQQLKEEEQQREKKGLLPPALIVKLKKKPSFL